MLWSDQSNNEAVEILSLTSSSITLKGTGTAKAWPVGTQALPARIGRITNASQMQSAGGLVDGVVHFEITDQPAITAQADTTTFNGVQVLTREHNWAAPINRSYARKMALLDDAVTERVWIDQSNWSHIARQLGFMLDSRSDIVAFRAWLASVCGRLTAFWLPVRETTMQPTRSYAINQSNFAIQNIGYSLLLASQPNRNTIAMLNKNGTWYYRTVTGATLDIVNGDEILSFSANIPVAHTPSDWLMVCPLELVRLDADAIEISRQNGGLADVSISVKGIKQ